MPVDDMNRAEDNNHKCNRTSKVLYSDDEVNLDESTIKLPKPIIVRPGFFYHICFDICDDGFDYPLCTQFQLMTNEVQIEKGINIEFRHHETCNGANRGLVSGLAFSKP